MTEDEIREIAADEARKLVVSLASSLERRAMDWIPHDRACATYLHLRQLIAIFQEAREQIELGIEEVYEEAAASG